MPTLFGKILAIVALQLVAASASAQQVWVQSLTGLIPPTKPHGYRYDLSVFPVDIQIFFQYTHGGTVDFQISFNGGPFNQGFPCVWNDGSGQPGYCFAMVPYNCGKLTIRVRQLRTFGTVTSNPVDIYVFNSPFCLPQCDSCQLTDLGQTTGKPVNTVTGKLWYQTTDLALSGPFGLRFSRWYDNQTAYNRDLGFGWRHNYSPFLDLSLQPTRQLITFRDEEDRVSYFTGLGPGGSVYDDISGSALALNGAGTIYTLSTWSNSKFAFDSAGRLTSLTDRIGNTQTIARDAGQGFRITSVADSLGRSLNFGYDGSNRITSVTTGPPGLSLAFSYSGANCPPGNLCSATMPDTKIWRYEYTGADPNNLTKVVNPLGNAEEINTYTGERVSSQQTEGGQNILNFSYGSNVTTVTDGSTPVRTTTYTYDPRLLLVTSVAGAGCGCGGGESRTFTYNPFLRKLTEQDGAGPTHRITWVYGRDQVVTYPNGFTDILYSVPSPTSRTEPLRAGVNRVTQWTYYPIGDLARRDLVQTESIPSADTGGQSKVTTNNFSTPQGLLLSRSEQGRIGGVVTTYTSSFTYDGRGRLLTSNGPRTDVTDVTTNVYYPDADSDLARRGQLQTVTDAAGNVTTYAGGGAPFNTYTLYGQPRRVADPNGVLREMTFDERGGLRISTLKGVPGDPVDLTTTYDLDDAGRLTKTTLPLGNGMSYGYDGSNRLTDTIRFDSSGNQQERLHVMPSVMGEKILEEAQSCDVPATTCASWTTRRSDAFQYDNFGRLWQTNHPDASTIFYTYDSAGNLQTVRDENHAAPNTTYGYDFANRLTSVTQTLIGVPGDQIQTLYGYDVHDNLNSVTDPNGNVTSYLYDDFRRMRRQTSPVSSVTNYTHDPAGNLLTATDADTPPRVTTRTYDAVNRALTAVSTRDTFPTETVTWTYDDPTPGNFGRGRLASMTDPSGYTYYGYERRGLLAWEFRNIQGSDYFQAYGYDGNGNRSYLLYPSGREVSYSFDFADRPYAASSGSTTFVSAASYRPFGPEQQLSFGNGTTKTADYDNRYRPIRNKLVKDSPLTTLAESVLVPDFVGNITEIQDVMDPGYNRTFGYDDLSRLTTANSGASLWGSGSHAYDRMGNMTSMGLGAVRNLTFAYQGTTPKLMEVTENAVPRSVSYDPPGNETQVGAGTFAYSTRNYLEAGESLTYVYDGRSLRAVTRSGANRRYSFYSPEMNLLAETQLTDCSPPPSLYEYIWFGGKPVGQIDRGLQIICLAGGVGAAKQSTSDPVPVPLDTPHWTFTDHLGTPLIQTDSAAAIYWRAEHEPYGRVFALRTPDRHQPLRFPGQEAEQLDLGANGATERSYNVFRWYRYGWGRYTQNDPIGLRGSINLFSYASQNPVYFLDPTGLCCTPADRTRDLLLALELLRTHKAGSFVSQVCNGDLKGCGYNAGINVAVLNSNLKCYVARIVDAGPFRSTYYKPELFKLIPHSFAVLEPINACLCPPPGSLTPIVADNYFSLFGASLQPIDNYIRW